MSKPGAHKMALTFLLSGAATESSSLSSRRVWPLADACDEVGSEAFPCSPVSPGGPTLESTKARSAEGYRLKSCDEIVEPQTSPEDRLSQDRHITSLQSSFDSERCQRTKPTRPDQHDKGNRREWSGTSVFPSRQEHRITTSARHLASAKDSSGLTVPNKSHRCFCGRVFNKREHLKRHDLLVHQDFRPFSCEDCSLRFGTKQNYQVHMTTNKHRQRIHFNKKRCIVGDRSESEQEQLGSDDTFGASRPWLEAGRDPGEWQQR